jgi:predicted TIM-barrel fold metal-dependent hydrolase
MLATRAWEVYPQRVVPFLAEGYTETLHPNASYRNPAGLEELLAGGFVRGLGEVILRHSAFRLGPSGGGYAAPATNVPADHPALLTAYALAGRYGAPVVVHQEAAFAEELERALRAAPDTRFVWAHAGHGPPAVVRQLLARHANLSADLSARTPWLGPGTVLTDPGGRLQPAWAALLADYPDRFLLGLDLFAPTHFRLGYVQDTVGYYRGLLGQLDPAVAEQIAFRNAERLAPFVVPTAAAP